MRIDRLWYSQNPVAWLLLPLSVLFCTLASIRRRLYRAGLLESVNVGAPVVVVGNISVGGTGKTPLIIALCVLLRQKGHRPGVISRGHGANVEGVHAVAEDDEPSRCGDEPLLIRQRTGCPVVVGRDRVAAANHLLAQHDCDVVLSDDGMQHYRLVRDVEIAVVDSRRGFGNGYCLPAGPLRELPSRLASVDIVVYSGSDNEAHGYRLEMEQAVNLSSGERRPLDSFRGERVHAVAGIGHPERFFSQLQAMGIEVVPHAYPDHYRYSRADIAFGDGAAVMMTEKDAVKCRHLPAVAAQHHTWAVPVDAVMQPALQSRLLTRVMQAIEGRAA